VVIFVYCNTYVRCNRLLLSTGFISIVRSDLYRAVARHSVIYRVHVSKTNALVGGAKKEKQGGKKQRVFVLYSLTLFQISHRREYDEIQKTNCIKLL
jgi:hypothetical protein